MERRLYSADSATSKWLIPKDMKPWAVYRLPFGLTYLLYDINDSSQEVEVETFCGVFLWQEASCADIRGWSVIKSLQSGLALKNEAFRILNLSDNRGYIQSTFLSGTGSRYKEELEGKIVFIREGV